MDRWPRISIVTPSFNQARYIVATVESVIAQDYPNLDHIVIDGGSTDGTLDRLARYTHVRLVSEADRGHADALNKGFRLATGEIWGFLNSDDTLLPGALHRVAREVDPGRGRQIVMGRCRFIDAEGRSSGLEHPSRFEGHRRVLEIWKGHTIPQPAVFWTPEVWKACGPMDDQLQSAWVDYDLFCRFSRRYRFHFVDQVLAAYRLHPESKTVRWAGTDRLEEGIAISRSHWGFAAAPAPLAAGAVAGALSYESARKGPPLPSPRPRRLAAGRGVRSRPPSLGRRGPRPRGGLLRWGLPCAAHGGHRGWKEDGRLAWGSGEAFRRRSPPISATPSPGTMGGSGHGWR